MGRTLSSEAVGRGRKFPVASHLGQSFSVIFIHLCVSVTISKTPEQTERRKCLGLFMSLQGKRNNVQICNQNQSELQKY